MNNLIQKHLEKVMRKHAEIEDCMFCHFLEATGFNIRDVRLITYVDKNGSVVTFLAHKNTPAKYRKPFTTE